MKKLVLLLFALLPALAPAELSQGRLVIQPMTMNAFSLVYVAEVASNRLALSALTPTGLKAFELSGTNGVLVSYTVDQAVPASRRGWLARSLFTAAWRIYASPFDPARPVCRRDSQHVWQIQPSGERFRYTLKEGRTVALRNSSFWGPSWCVLFSGKRAIYTTPFIDYTFEFQRNLSDEH